MIERSSRDLYVSEFQVYGRHAEPTEQPTYGELLTDAGGSVVNGAYAGGRFVQLKPLNVQCGIDDLNQVLNDYKILFQLRSVDDQYLSKSLVQGKHPLHHLPAELFPEALNFTFEEFVQAINSRLGCILDESQGKNLNLEISLLFDFMQERLRLRESFINSLNIDFEMMF